MTGVDEDMLQAYIDGRLPAHETRRLEGLLRRSPELRARVAQDVAIREALREAAGVAASRAEMARPPWAALAASGLLAVMAAGGGWWLRGAAPAPVPMADASAAYARFAASGLQLDRNHAFQAPDLSSLGYSLVGAGQVSTHEGPAQVAAYDGGARGRLIVYVRPAERPRPRDPGLRRSGGVETRYWFDAQRGYAIAGEAPPAEMASVEATVRRALSRT